MEELESLNKHSHTCWLPITEEARACCGPLYPIPKSERALGSRENALSYTTASPPQAVWSGRSFLCRSWLTCYVLGISTAFTTTLKNTQVSPFLFSLFPRPPHFCFLFTKERLIHLTGALPSSLEYKTSGAPDGKTLGLKVSDYNDWLSNL